MSETPPGREGLLEPGERILWQGRPATRMGARGRHLEDSFPGAVLLGFAFFGGRGADRIAQGDQRLQARVLLFAGVRGALGLCMALGHHEWSVFRGGRTWCIPTGRRANIATNIAGRRSLTSWPIGPDIVIDLLEGADNAVWVAEGHLRVKDGTRRNPAGFAPIEDPRKVCEMMQGIRKGAA